MITELTAKQEKFIQGIVRGLTQRQAYKEAYNTENMQDDTIDKEACLLFNNPKIAERYNELLKELQDKSIMSAQERMMWLTNLIKEETKNM